ncbi:hypothetical protein [Aestuariibacter sp. A3R04]|uniref:hypothetical protein n=1 Tax=Aestuariibacter sp. A3R04 TaxID=2841571 RepID=UPI001C09CA55|nr:hypothetical protein [Aestuariibacter sp. A3R04]MBU3023956.1 hypothetical protein [Aestuariibacter sp. A3R04]
MPANSKRIALLSALFPIASMGSLAQNSEVETLETTVVQAASEELKQAQGVSNITKEAFCCLQLIILKVIRRQICN